MANKVYIDIIGADITFSAICQEDINVQAISQFTRISDLVPEMNELVNLISTSGGVLSSRIQERMGHVKNAMDIPIWSKTEPVKIPLDLNFFVQTSGYGDVWRPTMLLQSMCILSRKGDKTLVTPGFNLNTIGKIDKTVTPADVGMIQKKASQADSISNNLSTVESNFPTSFPTTSKLCSLYIPGIVYIPVAILETIQITWSKQLTNLGYPIWSKVNCQFSGSSAAVFEDNFLSICPKAVSTSAITDLDQYLSNIGVSR